MENTYTLPPVPKGLPLLGNMLQLRRDQPGFLLDVQRRYGRMATIHIGRTPVVLLFRPEHIRYVLTENPRNFTNREVAGGLVFGKLLLFSLLARTFSNKVTEGLSQMVGDFLLTTERISSGLEMTRKLNIWYSLTSILVVESLARES